MDRPALGDGVCGICQQPLAGQHWERWLPCGDAVHRSCAARQRRAENLCPCCRIEGKAQIGRRDSSKDTTLLRKNCEQAGGASHQETQAGDALSLLCNIGMLEPGVASASINASLLSMQSWQVMCPLCSIRLQYGDPQHCVFCILKPQHLLNIVAERLGEAQQDTRAARNLHASSGKSSSNYKKVTSRRKCLRVKSLRDSKLDDGDGKASCGSLHELFEMPSPHDRSKLLNYKARSFVNPLQDISVWWSIERRVVKTNEEINEATVRRGAIRRRVQRRARARRRRNRQATIVGRRSAQEIEAEGTVEAETTPESHDEESTTYGLPELETEEGGDGVAEDAPGGDNPHSNLDDNQQLEEIVEEEDPEGQQEQNTNMMQDEPEQGDTDSDPDYTEPEGFEAGANFVDDEESIAPVTINRRIVDIEDSEYDEETASDASDTTQDNGHNYDDEQEEEGEQEDDHSDMLQSEETRAPTESDQAGPRGSYTFRNVGSSVSFWTSSHSLWSNLCARVRGCLPPCWRQSVQAVRNRLHQVNRPLEDIQADSERQDLNQNEEQLGTELDDFSALTQSLETRRVRRRMAR